MPSLLRYTCESNQRNTSTQSLGQVQEGSPVSSTESGDKLRIILNDKAGKIGLDTSDDRLSVRTSMSGATKPIMAIQGKRKP